MKSVNTYKHILLILLVWTGRFSAEAEVWTLQQCIDSAQVYNKNLQIGRNLMAIGGEKEKEARSAWLPRLNAHADYRYYSALPYQLMPLSTFQPSAPDGQFKEAQFGVPHNLNANLQFFMPLYNPQLYGAIQMSTLASELTAMQYRQTEEQVFYEISNLYYNAQIIYHQVAFIDSNLLNAQKLLIKIRLLREQSMARGTEVGKLSLQITQLENQKASAEAKYRQVLQALKLSVGLAPGLDLQIVPEIKMHARSAVSTEPVPDLRILEIRKTLLSEELSVLNKSRYLPSLHLYGTYGSNGFGYDKQPNDFLRFYPIGFAGIQVSYPIWNGQTTQSKIHQKKLEIRNNELQSDFVAGQIKMQTEQALQQRELAMNSLETAQEQIRLARSVFEQTLLLQQEGSAALSEVLLADNALREARQNYLSTLIDYLRSDLELRRLNGQIATKS